MIDPNPRPVHLAFLIHGLWGNPQHLDNLAKGLRAKHPEEKLRILVAKSNTSNYTYDGIEVGGERVAQELGDEIQRLARDENVAVTKLSIIGYSLGGLIARYLIGLLHARGLFDRIEPVNFTAFASPFLGVRSPSASYRAALWNVLGARTLSASGQQMFLVDTFRDTGRPLLSVLADPDSVFMKGLARFRRRTAYANVQNDRSVPYFTAGFAARDPFEDLGAVDLRFVPGYERVVLDPKDPAAAHARERDPSLVGRLKSGSRAVAAALPYYAFATLVMPFGIAYFLINAGFQSVQSNRRIRLHDTAGLSSRIPLIEDALALGAPRHLRTRSTATEKGRDDPLAEFPTLALLPEQFEMIKNLDRMGFRKYPVLIERVRHTHAAIIVRYKRDGLKEGFTVIKHWVEEEFVI